MRVVPNITAAHSMVKPLPTLGELFVLDHIVQVFKEEQDIDVFFQPKIGSLRADIVVLRKGYGCTIVEVKDWSIDSYRIVKVNDSEDGYEWYSKSSNAKILSPHGQVVNYKKRLFSEAGLELAKQFNQKVYGLIKTTMVLTNTAHDLAVEVSHKYVPVFGRNGLSDDRDGLLSDLRLKHRSDLFNEKYCSALLRVLDPPITPMEPVVRVKLSDRQRSAIQLPETRRRKIRGVAGSGKTLVGVTLASQAAATGLSVLILVYNNAAKSGVEKLVRSIDVEFPRSSVTIENIFRFADPFSGVDAGNHLLARQYFDVVQDSISKTLKNRVNLPDYERYDLIVIDEAQDHLYDWMQILEQDYLSEKGTLLILADEAQNIYGTLLEDQRVRTPITGAWFRLAEHKRSDPKITRLCDQFRQFYLNDDEPTDQQTEISTGIFELQEARDSTLGGLTRELITNISLVNSLTSPDSQQTCLIIARTSTIIRTVTEACKSVAKTRVTIRSMMETDVQRALMFAKAIQSTMNRYGTSTRCTTVLLTPDELQMIGLAFDPRASVPHGHTPAGIVAEHLTKEDSGGESLPVWYRSLYSLYNRTLLAEESREAEAYQKSSDGDNTFKSDIAHTFSFDLAQLRVELKKAAFVDDSSVVISTAHSSKGIERDRVFVIIDDKWHSNPNANELLYTALTRAKSELYIICSANSPYLSFFSSYLSQL